VIFLWDHGLLTGEPKVPIMEQNANLFTAARKYPDKFIPFAHIDPRRPKAIEFIKKCVEEWGAKGLKLLPIAGFNPEESETMRLIEAVADYHIPVITHTGHGPTPTSSRFGDPIFLDKMLLDFPDLKVIAAHLSLGYRQQLFSFAWMRPNLYTEISMLQPFAKTDYPAFARIVREALNAFGPERILFGTDSPWLEGILSGTDFVGAVKDLPRKSPEGVAFSDREIEMLLGINACNCLV
jgi:predicted TIM-barrel fold metal-dependent hydrolase